MQLWTIGRGVTAGVLAVLMIGCEVAERNAAPEPAQAPAEAAGSASAADGERERVVLFVGTSLTAGLGLPEREAFPHLLQARIDSAGLPYRTVNAGVSGETSAGALSRLDWLLRQPFDVLVLETGANDMLRGVPPEAVEANIQTIVDRVRERRPDARIVLAGMLAAPNLGRAYVREFEAIYPRLAERNDLELIPFLLDGVAAVPDLNQEDGIHPTAEGHLIIADNVWAVLGEVLEDGES